MSGRRAEDERGEVLRGEALRGGGAESAGAAGIGVGAADSGSGSGAAGSAGSAGPVGAPAVAVSVPGRGGPAGFSVPGVPAGSRPAAAGGSEAAADSSDSAALLAEQTATATPPVDSATRLNAGRVSPRGVDRGGHVHRVDVPKTPAQGGDRDVLSPDESSASNADGADSDGGNNGDAGGDDRPDGDDRGAEAELASTADLSGPQLVGRRLLLARRHAGLSVEEVGANTRIRGTMIRQIEGGDFSRCGGEVYARGHVRAIAKAVGVDAETLLGGQGAPVVLVVAEPAAPRPSVSAPVSPPPPKAKTKAKDKQLARGGRVIRPAKAAIGTASAASAALPAVIHPRRNEKAGVIGRQSESPNWTAAMLVVLLGLVVFGGMQLIGGDNSKPAAAHVPPPAPKPAAVPAPAPAPAPVPTSVAVKIAATGADSWLAVFSSDGKKLYDNLLPSGSSQTFNDGHKLDVTVGNAAAIRMQLNGKDVAPSGGDGEVLHFAVNPTSVVAG